MVSSRRGSNREYQSARDLRKEEILESYEIVGDTGLPREEIPKRLNLKTGSPFRYLDLQERLEELKDRYAKEGYLEARIRQSRQTDAGRVRLTLNFDVGRRLAFRFEGYDVDKATRKEVTKSWRSGIVERQRLDAALSIVRRALFQDRYCDAEVEAENGETEGKTTPVVFSITPGLRYSHVAIRFDKSGNGLSGELIRRLRRPLEGCGGYSSHLQNPPKFRFYQTVAPFKGTLAIGSRR